MAAAKQTKKKSPARKPQAKRAPAKQTAKGSMRPEVASLLIIAAGILLGIFLYIPSGIVGGFLRDLLLGLWGLPVFLLPILVLANGIHLAVGKNYPAYQKTYVVLFLALFLLSGLIHILSGTALSNPFMLASLSTYYMDGTVGLGGGLFGGVLADTLRAMVGTAATVTILLVLLAVIVMILTKWSPVKALLRAILSGYARAKAAKASYQEEVAQYAAAQPQPAPAPRQRKRRMPNFSEEDVVREPADKPDNDNKQKDEETYLPPSLRNISIEGEPDAGAPAQAATAEDNMTLIDNIDEILEHALPTSKPTLAFTPDDGIAPTLEDMTQASHAAADDLPWDPDLAAADAEEDAAATAVAEEAPEEAVSEEAVPDEIPAGDVGTAEALDTGEESLAETDGSEFAPVYERIPYTFPPLDLLDDADSGMGSEESRNEIKETAQKLVSTLKSFNVDVKLLNVSKGPTVTRYELLPGEGVKVSKIVNLSDDIALRLAATGVRIEAPIPNKEAIGIEIPNRSVDMVHLKEVLDSDEFRNAQTRLAFGVGKDIAGKNVVFDIGKMPHVLIAGATGSGKSVCINTLITSLIYKSDPNDVKLLMVDPKVVELGMYNGIPHLLIPVVTDPKRASGALYWAVQEMVRRYNLFADSGVRDIKGYNQMVKDDGREDTMPHIVIIIDELSDLMMVAPNEVEDSICRLAQMARAAGMHLVIATQRPSVDVITGIIKANIPSRIAFAVSSQVDSRTILDQAGAEKLLGRGDMLFYPVGAAKPIRLQGAFVSDKEVDRVVHFIKDQATVRYDDNILETIENGKAIPIKDEADAGDNDELLPRAIEIAMDAGKVSASYLQRRLKVGFSRAARIVDQMEERGIIGPQDGSKPRELLITKEEYFEMTMRS